MSDKPAKRLSIPENGKLSGPRILSTTFSHRAEIMSFILLRGSDLFLTAGQNVLFV